MRCGAGSGRPERARFAARCRISLIAIDRGYFSIGFAVADVDPGGSSEAINEPVRPDHMTSLNFLLLN
jgi:hypothetical protein